MLHPSEPPPEPLLDGQFKGYPQDAPPMSLAEASRQGWNLLHGDLGFPALVIRQDAMEHMIEPGFRS